MTDLNPAHQASASALTSDSQSSHAVDLTAPLRVKKRSGMWMQWDRERILRAMLLAFHAVCSKTEDRRPSPAEIEQLATQIEQAALTDHGADVHVEQVQDIVERVLMKDWPAVAKAYILYRNKRAEERAQRLTPDNRAIADYIHAAKYAQWSPEKQRRETYLETVDRVRTMHLHRFGIADITEENSELRSLIDRAFRSVENKRVLPAMRTMQFGGKAVLDRNIRSYNCTFSHCDRLRFFGELLWILLAGPGAGVSVQFQHVERLPAVKFIDEKKVRHIVIDDSCMGWADAVNELFRAYFIHGDYVEFAYHKIRDEGSPLSSGGRAPGHKPLKQALEAVRAILDNARGRQLRPIECFDICCLLADAVLAGGIRRSSLIILFSLGDYEMMTAKAHNNYRPIGHPQGPLNAHRGNANISAVCHRQKVEWDDFRRLISLSREWGEPGFYFTDDEDYGTNPCVTGDTWVQTSEGPQRVCDLVGKPFQALVDGKTYAATGFWMSGIKSVYRLETDRGYQVRLTADHKVLVSTRSGTKWVKANELQLGDRVVIGNHRSVSSAIDADEFNRGWLIGEMVGDGGYNPAKYTGHVRFWGEHRREMAESAAAIVMRHGLVPSSAPFRGARHYGTSQVETRTLDELARGYITAGDKQILPALESASPSLVAGFLRGFFDADGSVQGDVRKGRSVRLSQSDELRLRAVQRMLLRFGVAARLFLNRRAAGEQLLPDGRGGNRMYPTKAQHELVISRDNIRVYAEHVGFSDPDKAAKLEQLLGSTTRADYRDGFTAGFTALVPDGVESVYDCTVDEVHRFDANGITVANCGEIGMMPRLRREYVPDRSLDFDWRQYRNRRDRSAGYAAPRAPLGAVARLAVDEPRSNGSGNGNGNGKSTSDTGFFTRDAMAKAAAKIEADADDDAITTYGHSTGWQACNLCEVNVAACETAEDLEQAARDAATIGTLQAAYTDFWYLGPVTERVIEREALLGVGLTGMQDRPDLAFDASLLRRAATAVRAQNERVAKMIGVRPAARATTVKPSGTASLELGCVGSGIHHHHARRYFRRVTANVNEAPFLQFRRINPHMCQQKPNGDWVITFPVQAPDHAGTVKGSSAPTFMEQVFVTYENWIRYGRRPDSEALNPGLQHNVSCTVTVQDDEWDTVIQTAWQNRHRVTAMSFFSAFNDKLFPFAPREEVNTPEDEARWNRLISLYRPMDWDKVVETYDGTKFQSIAACAGQQCELVV